MDRATRRFSHEELIIDHIEKITIIFLLFWIFFKVSLPNRLKRNLHACPNIEIELWMLVRAKVEKVCTSYIEEDLLQVGSLTLIFWCSMEHTGVSLIRWSIYCKPRVHVLMNDTTEPLMPLMRHQSSFKYEKNTFLFPKVWIIPYYNISLEIRSYLLLTL